MTTRQRLDLLARAFPRLFPRAELARLLRVQLGHVDALERQTVRAPQLIFHICAGNLAVSAWTSLAFGLLLGARNVVKLPGDRDDATTRREILDFIRRLPAPLQKLVSTHRTLDSKMLAWADAVIAFGSESTMTALRAQVRWDQKFIAHGPAASLLWIADPGNFTPAQARACAVDVLTYDQLGCLSPQAIYVPRATGIQKIGDLLAHALDSEWRRLKTKPRRLLPTAARITEARDLAHALGHRTWLPAHLGWTLIYDPSPIFQPSPLHGVIYLRSAPEARIPAALAPIAGRISTVGHTGPLSSRLRETFLSLGVSRFCPAGRMQFPPLTWHHDGRPVLGDLVTWIDAE